MRLFVLSFPNPFHQRVWYCGFSTSFLWANLDSPVGTLSAFYDFCKLAHPSLHIILVVCFGQHWADKDCFAFWQYWDSICPSCHMFRNNPSNTYGFCYAAPPSLESTSLEFYSKVWILQFFKVNLCSSQITTLRLCNWGLSISRNTACQLTHSSPEP